MATSPKIHTSIFHCTTSHSLSNSLTLQLLFALSSLSSSFSSFFHHHDNQTFITNPFKDHIFWSLGTRFKHYNLHFLKNTRALILTSWNRHHHHQGGVFSIFLFLLQEDANITLGSELLLLFVVQENWSFGFHHDQELQVTTWEKLHAFLEQCLFLESCSWDLICLFQISFLECSKSFHSFFYDACVLVSCWKEKPFSWRYLA